MPVPANAEALSKSLASRNDGDLSEAQARQILEAAFDRADATDEAELAAFIRALDKLDDLELLTLAATL